MKLKLLVLFLSWPTTSLCQSKIDEVLGLMNEVRTNPSLFLKDRLLPYLAQKPMEENTYVRSLKEELENRQAVGALTLSPVLSGLAKGHATDMGKHGTVSHDSSNGTPFAERVRKKVKNGLIAENCDYGNETAIDIVMSLLIDDGVQSLGHRKTILNPQLHFVGIAIEPHKSYGTNCVMDFAEIL
jgi:uncharacterized protein YkwD